jgi:hypothetical protein
MTTFQMIGSKFDAQPTIDYRKHRLLQTRKSTVQLQDF